MRTLRSQRRDRDCPVVVERGTSLRRRGSAGSQQPAPARTAFDDRIRPTMLPLPPTGSGKGFPKDFLRLRQRPVSLRRFAAQALCVREMPGIESLIRPEPAATAKWPPPAASLTNQRPLRVDCDGDGRYASRV